MEIFELLNIKTKKELKTFLNSNAIVYRKRHGEYSFAYSFYDVEFNVYVFPIHNTIDAFRLVMNDEKYNHYDKVNKMLWLKDIFTSTLGKPRLDSSNHLDNNYLAVKYETDSFVLSIKCHDTKEYGSRSYAAIFLGAKNYKEENIKRSIISDKLALWIPSLIGGFVFGAAMFGTMGSLANYDIKYFWICMILGLFFGVSFALIFGLIHKIDFQTKQGSQKKNILKEHFKLEEDNQLYEGNLYTYVSTTPHATKQRVDCAYLKVTDIDIVIYSMIKKNETVLKMPIKEGYYKLLINSIAFSKENNFYRFSLNSHNEYVRLENFLFEKLIDKNELNALFEKLKLATTNYNPYQLYDDDNNYHFLDSDIEIIAKAILLKPDIHRDELHQLLTYIFEFDRYYADSLTDLYIELLNN